MRTLVLLGMLSLLLGCGKNGKDGAAGPSGTNGTNGSNGTSGTTLVSGIVCGKTDAGSGTSIIFGFKTVLYSSGDRFVEGELSTDKTYSSSQVYKSTQPGSTTGGIIVNYNLPGDPIGAFWRLSLVGSTARVVYYNAGGAHDQYTYTFVPADCVVF